MVVSALGQHTGLFIRSLGLKRTHPVAFTSLPFAKTQNISISVCSNSKSISLSVFKSFQRLSFLPFSSGFSSSTLGVRPVQGCCLATAARVFHRTSEPSLGHCHRCRPLRISRDHSGASTKMVGTGMVEYAKSSRSTCKQCAVKIDKGVLRVGSTTKGPGGIDMTKWYHPNCYFASEGEKGPVEKLAGLSLVNAADKALLESLSTSVSTGGGAVGTKREHEGTLDGPTSKKAAKGADGGAIPATPELGKDARAKAETYDRKVWYTLLTTFSPSKLSNTYKGAVLPVGWKSFQTVIIGEIDQVEPSSKIAAFDFDGCLVKTDIRRHGADAWSLRYPGVPEQLQKYHKEGYKLVIFTNESNIDAWSSSRQKAVDSKIGRLTGFIAAAGVPMQVFIACGKSNTGDACRKPAPGMWDVMERLNGGVSVNREASLFVGDAAGRPTDFSNSDREFAANVGVKFMVPEHVFM